MTNTIIAPAPPATIPVYGAQRAHVAKLYYTPLGARLAVKRLTPLVNERARFTGECPRLDTLNFDLHNANVPKWANGVRAMKTGFLSYAVVATDTPGAGD